MPYRHPGKFVFFRVFRRQERYAMTGRHKALQRRRVVEFDVRSRVLAALANPDESSKQLAVPMVDDPVAPAIGICAK